MVQPHVDHVQTPRFLFLSILTSTAAEPFACSCCAASPALDIVNPASIHGVVFASTAYANRLKQLGAMGATRKHHTKSRLGCRQCKSRHQRCDQQRPTCGGCQKAGKICSLEAPSETEHARNTASPGSSTSAPASEGLHDSLDMLLFYHWALVAHKSMTVSPKIRDIHLNLIPLRALGSPMLMHGLLALSALQKYYIRDGNPAELQRFYLRALDHHTKAVAMYKSAVEGKDASLDLQIGPAYLHFFMGFEFALFKLQPAPKNLDDLISIFLHIRTASRLLFDAAMKASVGSDLAPLFGVMHEDIPVPPDFSAIVKDLDLLAPICTSQTTQNAAYMLAGILRTPIISSLEFSLMASFPNAVDDSFFEMVQARDLSALRVFHHYCRALFPLWTTWFMADWTPTVGEAIHAAGGDEEPLSVISTAFKGQSLEGLSTSPLSPGAGPTTIPTVAASLVKSPVDSEPGMLAEPLD